MPCYAVASAASINDSVANINNLASPLPTPTLTIPTPSISPAHEQTPDEILPYYNCLAISHLKMLRQAADGHPTTPVSGYLTTGLTTSSSGLIQTIPALYQRVIVTAEDVREIAVHWHLCQTKSLSVGGPVRKQLQVRVPAMRTLH